MTASSGYDVLFRELRNFPERIALADVRLKNCFPNLLLRKTRYRRYWNIRPSERYGYSSIDAEIRMVAKSREIKPDVVFYSVGDTTFALGGARREKFCGKLVATMHQPPGWWKLNYWRHEYLRALDQIITVSSAQAEYFNQFTRHEAIFIPHGIDTAFYRPAEPHRPVAASFLFVGHHLRDFRSLERIVHKLLSMHPGISFDFVIPNLARDKPELASIASNPACNFHADLTSDELLKLYQQSSALMLPLIDATANNAVLEALACGLPVVATDCAGVRDYTAPSNSFLIPHGDTDRFVSSLLLLAREPGRRGSMAIAARVHAVSHLAWPVIAERTLEVLEDVSARE